MPIDNRIITVLDKCSDVIDNSAKKSFKSIDSFASGVGMAALDVPFRVIDPILKLSPEMYDMCGGFPEIFKIGGTGDQTAWEKKDTSYLKMYATEHGMILKKQI